MKLKSALFFVVTMVIMSVMLVGCSGNNNEQGVPAGNAGTPTDNASIASDAPVTLQFMLNSPELTVFYNNMAAAYHEYTGGRVTIEMFIEQADYQTLLLSRLNAGQTPDLFMSSAYAENILFRDFTVDLTDQAFMQYFDPVLLSSVKVGDDITGYPFLLQAHGYIFNTELFEQAGITTLPETYSELRAASEALSAIGIQPFASGFAEWWVLPQTVYPSMSDVFNGDFEGLFAAMESGAVRFGDLPELDFAFDILDLINEFSGARPMESTFDDQVSAFARGEVAMIHQGTWAEDAIRSANPDIQMGFVLHPRLDGQAVLAVDSNLTFRVGRTDNAHETFAWLEWLTTSEFGRSWIPSQIQQISPQRGAAMPDTMLAMDTAYFMATGQVAPWWIFTGPEGIEEPFGRAFQSYVAGTSTRDQVRDELNMLFDNAFLQSRQ